MIPKSMRWRLPLSYAAIALLAALALGLVLLTTLRRYYRQQELDYLTNNAQVMGSVIARLFKLDPPSTWLQPQLRSFSFLSQTRVRLLDTESQELADSGAPQDQQGVVILAREGEKLNIQIAKEMPDEPADVAGLFVRREDNSLFVGTGSTSGVKVDGRWELHHDGPVVEVVTTHDTLIYRDDTLQQLGGVAPSGPIKQVLEPGSLDEIGKNSTVEAWGKRRDDRVVAEVVVFSSQADDTGVSPEGEWSKVEPSTVPDVVTLKILKPRSDEGIIESSENWPIRMEDVYSIYATPYGFGLNAEAPSEGHRSDQVIRQPFHDQGGELLGYVELSEGPAYGRQILVSVTRGWAIAGSVAVLLAAVAGWMASRRITTPLLALISVTTQMAKGDLSARADVAREDELGLLARSFNEMAGRVEGTIITLRHFVSDAAHEIHTPLTALRTNLELAPDEEFVRRAQAQVKRLERLTEGLLDLSRVEAGGSQEKHSPLELVTLVQQVSELYASRAEQAGLAFSLTLPESPVTVRGDRAQLRRGLENLFDNAIKFTPEGGSVGAGIHQHGGQVELWVEDTGIGIPVDDLPRLFDRFHRGCNAAGYPGSGLGLAIAKAIVENHGGRIEAESVLGEGTRLFFTLPETP
jgi:signal transduction histidine kinase